MHLTLEVEIGEVCCDSPLFLGQITLQSWEILLKTSVSCITVGFVGINALTYESCSGTVLIGAKQMSMNLASVQWGPVAYLGQRGAMIIIIIMNHHNDFSLIFPKNKMVRDIVRNDSKISVQSRGLTIAF